MVGGEQRDTRWMLKKVAVEDKSAAVKYVDKISIAQ